MLGWVPLVVLAFGRGTSQLFWVPRPNLTAAWQMLLTLTSAGLAPSFPTDASAIVLVVLTVALVALAARRPGSGPVLAWLLVPLVLGLLESLIGQSIFVPRNLLVCLPAVALALALALTDPRLPRVVGLGGLALIVVLRAIPLGASYGVSPEDWKGATSYVLARTRPADCVAFYPSDARMPFAFYLGSRPAPRPVAPAAPFGPLRPYVEDYAGLPPRATAGCQRMWLVSSHAGQLGGTARSRRDYAGFIALRGALERAYPHHRVARFGYAAVIRVELLSGP